MISDINELTPVDEFHDIGPFKKIYFKRDDIFRPYDDSLLDGGKVRQSVSLFGALKDELKKIKKTENYPA